MAQKPQIKDKNMAIFNHYFAVEKWNFVGDTLRASEYIFLNTNSTNLHEFIVETHGRASEYIFKHKCP